MASYDGPATVIWKHKQTVKSAASAASLKPIAHFLQGQLVRYPRKLCRRWESEDDIVTLRLPQR